MNLKPTRQRLPTHHSPLMSPRPNSSQQNRPNRESVACHGQGSSRDEVSEALRVVPLVMQREELGY